MEKVQPRRPSGFNEYLPHQQIAFNRLLDIIRTTYERYGFTPLDTPDLELSEVLLAKSGGETEKQIYRFEHGRNNLSLRFDLTVPLARYVAEHHSQLTFPFRRYAIGKVHRAERAQSGRFREFYQCDIDVIGSDSPIIDAEFPAIINEIFEKFGFGEFTIRLNDRRVVSGFFEAAGMAQWSQAILTIIDRMEKQSSDETSRQLLDLGLTSQQCAAILAFTTHKADTDDTLAWLKAQYPEAASYQEGVAKLEVLVSALRDLGVPESRFVIDLKIVRGLDYYTGTVYETILNEHPDLGSVCSGGRYDDLTSYYTKTALPGVGISIGISRLFSKLLEAGIIEPSAQTPAHVIVMPIDEAQSKVAVKVAAALRAANTPTMLYTEPQPIGKKMRFASRLGVPYVVIIGAQEVEKGTVVLKDMKTRESITLPISELKQRFSNSSTKLV